MLILEMPTNDFDMESAMKGAEALYILNLLSFFLDLEERALSWKVRVS